MLCVLDIFHLRNINLDPICGKMFTTIYKNWLLFKSDFNRGQLFLKTKKSWGPVRSSFWEKATIKFESYPYKNTLKAIIFHEVLLKEKKSIKEFKDDPNIQNTKNKQYAKKELQCRMPSIPKIIVNENIDFKIRVQTNDFGPKSLEYEIFRQIKTISIWTLFKGKIINYLRNETNRNIFEAPGPSLLKTYFSNTFQGLTTNKHFSPPKINIFQVEKIHSYL